MRIALIAVASTVALLGACNKSGDREEGPDAAGNSPPVNAVQDMAAGPVGMVSAATVGANTTEGYVTNAAIADMYEIEAAKVAQQRATDPRIKQLAATILKDHTTLSQGLKAAAATANVTVPAALDDRRQGLVENLRTGTAAGFDLAYLHQQAAAHLEAVTLHGGYADNGDNPALKAAAAKATPMVKHHLEQVRAIGGDKLKAALPGGQ